MSGRIVAPKREKLFAALASLKQKEDALAEAMRQFQKLQEKLEKLQEMYDAKMREKEELIKLASVQSPLANRKRSASGASRASADCGGSPSPPPPPSAQDEGEALRKTVCEPCSSIYINSRFGCRGKFRLHGVYRRNIAIVISRARDRVFTRVVFTANFLDFFAGRMDNRAGPCFSAFLFALRCSPLPNFFRVQANFV